MTTILRKNSELPTSGHNRLLYVLSDSSVDRYNDVVEASGWDLSTFNQNPIALANHDPAFPIGKWDGLHISGNRLMGHLELAPEGTSARIDEVRKLVYGGFLPACSVGFIPIASEPRKTGKGVRYTKQILAEASVVSIPANANALMQVRALGISSTTIKRLFIDPPVDGSIAQRQVAARAALARDAELWARVAEGNKRVAISMRNAKLADEYDRQQARENLIALGATEKDFEDAQTIAAIQRAQGRNIREMSKEVLESEKFRSAYTPQDVILDQMDRLSREHQEDEWNRGLEAARKFWLSQPK